MYVESRSNISAWQLGNQEASYMLSLYCSLEPKRHALREGAYIYRYIPYTIGKALESLSRIIAYCINYCINRPMIAQDIIIY